jgi:hypothetical protein
MDWRDGSPQELADARPGRWRPHQPATKPWAQPEPLRALRALPEQRVRPVPPGHWLLPGPDCRSSERPMRASRPEAPAPPRAGGQRVPPAAAALRPDAEVLLRGAVELPPAPAPAEQPPRGSAHCGLARSEATRPGVGEQWAVAMARLWGQKPQAAVLLRPLGERQTLRYTRHSGPGYQPQAPWRDRRDRRWRSSGKSRSYHDPHA